jgi:hypothetical protein
MILCFCLRVDNYSGSDLQGVVDSGNSDVGRRLTDRNRRAVRLRAVGGDLEAGEADQVDLAAAVEVEGFAAGGFGIDYAA